MEGNPQERRRLILEELLRLRCFKSEHLKNETRKLSPKL
jgi:hypothetical protein